MFLIELPKHEQLASGLESWDWIDFSGLDAMAVSCFGDVFFESWSRKSILMLDIVDGTLKDVCDTREQFEHILRTEEGEDKYLLGGLVIAARNNGLVLEDGECYHFKVEPVLGGRTEVANLMKMSFVVSLNISGQLHRQVKDLPAGTRIKEFKFVED